MKKNNNFLNISTLIIFVAIFCIVLLLAGNSGNGVGVFYSPKDFNIIKISLVLIIFFIIVLLFKNRKK